MGVYKDPCGWRYTGEDAWEALARREPCRWCGDQPPHEAPNHPEVGGVRTCVPPHERQRFVDRGSWDGNGAPV